VSISYSSAFASSHFLPPAADCSSKIIGRTGLSPRRLGVELLELLGGGPCR
jgi:hypothetical protein